MNRTVDYNDRVSGLSTARNRDGLPLQGEHRQLGTYAVPKTALERLETARQRRKEVRAEKLRRRAQRQQQITEIDDGE